MILTSGQFADLLSWAVDTLITIDPHLHRHKALSEIYPIPALALHAARCWRTGSQPM